MINLQFIHINPNSPFKMAFFENDDIDQTADFLRLIGDDGDDNDDEHDDERTED